MKKWWICCVVLCLLPFLVQAEETPCWPEPQLLQPHESWNKTRFVYPHPEEFTPETGKVSFAGKVWCYGYVTVASPWEDSPDTLSLLIRYEKDSGGEHIAWITNVRPEEIAGQGLMELQLAEGDVLDLSGMPVTDDPYGKQTTLGTMIGPGYAVAYLDDLWACVSGECEIKGRNDAWPVLAFAKSTELTARKNADLDLPHRDALKLVAATPLNLPEKAADILNVYELPDGTFLIAYHCEGSSKLWLRVIDWEGKKLFGKSVPEGAGRRITVTEDGFLCDCFDDAGKDSGTRYTYRCRSRKLSSGKIAAGEDMADSAASAELPLHIAVPEGCIARPFASGEDGGVYLALNTGAAGFLCLSAADGTLYHLADMGQEVAWVSRVGDYGIFYSIVREMGEYTLFCWEISE